MLFQRNIQFNYFNKTGVNVHETRDTDLIDPSRSHRCLRINLFFADLRPIPARLIEATIRESRSIKFTMRV